MAEWQTQRTQKPQALETAEHFRDVADAKEDDRGSSESLPTRFPDTSEDPIEGALAVALTAAAEAGRFDVVAQLATELQARRVARAGAKIIDLGERRRR